jgi:hypothetical protein
VGAGAGVVGVVVVVDAGVAVVGAGAAGVVGVVPAAAALGALSKATVIWKAAMKSWVAQPPPLVLPESAVDAPPVSAPPGRSELVSPTRVTPSMSRSAARNPATASWPVAQPLI